MTRRLIKIGKRTKKVMLSHSNVIPSSNELQSMQSTKSIKRTIKKSISNTLMPRDLLDTNPGEILIGPQTFDPGVEALNDLTGSVQISAGSNVRIWEKPDSNNILEISATGNFNALNPITSITDISSTSKISDLRITVNDIVQILKMLYNDNLRG